MANYHTNASDLPDGKDKVFPTLAKCYLNTAQWYKVSIIILEYCIFIAG